MPLFEPQPSDTVSRGRLALAVQLASLLATGCVVWFVSLAPRLHRRTLGSLLLEAVGYAFLAWAWSAAITAGLYLLMPIADRLDTIRAAFRTSAVAVWFAPATILLSQFSPAALAAALVLVVGATRLLYSQWRQFHPIVEAPRTMAPRVPGSFADCRLPEIRLWRELAPGLAVSSAIQAGVVAVLLHYPLMAAAFFAMGVAFLTAFSMASGVAGAGRQPSLPRSILGVVMTVLLAVGLTVGGSPGVLGRGAGWIWNLQSRGRPELIASWRALLRQLFYHELPADPLGIDAAAPRVGSPVAAGTGIAAGFPGVILWPEVKPVTTLIAPLPATGNALFSVSAPRPLGIPFSGEYWMYRWPYARPPHDSWFQRGSPAALAFTTTDHTPLQMEARHQLDTPIEIRCCGRIQLEIWNADRFPGTISLELVLADSDHRNVPPLSLGAARVLSSPRQHEDHTVAAREILEFSVPASSTLTEFNQFRVIFHRDRSRIDKSAKIEIARFILLPRPL